MDDTNTLANHLIQAVIDNDVEQVSTLLNQGADPNITLDMAAVTPLHYAAQYNALEVIPLLIEAGALLEAQTEPEGYTPTEIAFIHGYDRLAQTLIAYIQELDAQRH